MRAEHKVLGLGPVLQCSGPASPLVKWGSRTWFYLWLPFLLKFPLDNWRNLTFPPSNPTMITGLNVFEKGLLSHFQVCVFKLIFIYGLWRHTRECLWLTLLLCSSIAPDLWHYMWWNQTWIRSLQRQIHGLPVILSLWPSINEYFSITV